MNLYLQVILFTLAGWVNRHQQAVIECLQAENQSLREQLGKKRIRWTDAQRRRLAEKAKAIGRSALRQLGTVVTPDTLLRWYRNLVAAKYDGAKQRGPGRPPTPARAPVPALPPRHICPWFTPPRREIP